MRYAALLLAAAGVLAGCGSGAPTGESTSSGLTLQQVWDRPGENVTVVPGDADFSPGMVRYSFLVVGKDGRPVYRPTADVAIARALDQRVLRRVTARLEPTTADPKAPGGIYVAQLPLRAPGTYWLVAQPKGADVQALGEVQVRMESASPAVGSAAPRSDTPTLADAPAATLTTRRPPDRDLLRYSIAQSIAAKKPFVVTFATPKFCQSRTCGPVVDVVEKVAREKAFRDVRFIHVEIFKNNDPDQGQNRWVQQWKLPSEPWVFLVGADGRIKAKFEGALSVRELRNAVKTTLVG